MPAKEYTFDGTDTWIGHRGRPDISVILDDAFVIGTTMPVYKGSGHVDNNVGPRKSDGTPAGAGTTDLANYAGTINFSNGPVNISGLNITTKQTVVGTGHRISDCRLVSTYSGDSGGGHFNCLDASVEGVVFDHIEVIPATPDDRFDAIYGHGFTIMRSVLTQVVDGIKATNAKATPGAPLYVTLLGNWIGHLSWYKDDGYAAGRPNSHNDGTHNDGIQHIANKMLFSQGNVYQGARYNALNPANVTLNSNGIDFVTANGNNVDKLPLTVGSITYGQQATNAILTQHDSVTQSPVGQITSLDDWFFNWINGLKVESDASKAFGSGQYRTIDVTLRNGKFGGVWKDDGSTHHWFPVRMDTNTIFNGRSYTGRSGAWTNNDGHAAEDNNCWMPGYGLASASATPVPITYRVDSKPVAQA